MYHNPLLNNPHYDDCYFSYDNGFAEATYVFIEGNGLNHLPLSTLVVGETGFGTGLNLLALVECLRTTATPVNLSFHSVEKYPLTPCRIKELFTPFIGQLGDLALEYLNFWDSVYTSLSSGENKLSFTYECVTIDLFLFVGDAADFMRQLQEPMDAWFLDGHSPDKNPDMWTEDLFANIGIHSHATTTFATFTAAGIVRRGMNTAGFYTEKKAGFGGKRHMMIGCKTPPRAATVPPPKTVPRHLRDFTPKHLR